MNASTDTITRELYENGCIVVFDEFDTPRETLREYRQRSRPSRARTGAVAGIVGALPVLATLFALKGTNGR